MKEYEPLNPRVIAKWIPHLSENFNRVDTHDFTCPCRFCGFPLHEYGDVLGGQAAYMTCDTFGCPNNIESKSKISLNSNFINHAGCTFRKFVPFEPRRIV